MLRLAVITALLALAACASPQTRAPALSPQALADEALAQKRFVIEQRLADARRVARIHAKLSAANLDFCETRSKSIGIQTHSISTYPKKFRDAAKALGLTGFASVAYVDEGSPAARAGVLPGDVVLAVGNEKFAAANGSARGVQRAIASWTGGGAIPLTLRRGDETIALSVQPVNLCGYTLVLADEDDLNAYADDEEIVLFRGMLRFVQNDDELALVIGHELAHSALRHGDAKGRNATLGSAGGALVDIMVAVSTGYASDTFSQAGGALGRAAYSQAFETEADYAGLYFIARAGYRLDEVENFWRRMAVEHPSGVTNLESTHPTTPQRFLTLAATRDEIRAKQARGEELLPEFKKPAAR